jgi:hypothetical protein
VLEICYLPVIFYNLPYQTAFHSCSSQIASTIATSGNKVYLDADSLMINTLGDNNVTDNSNSAAGVKKSSGGWY